jgi:amino acid transporter
LGVEIIAIVAEETERQRETLPHAVRRVAYRGLLYHVGAIFVLGLNVSSNDPILKYKVTRMPNNSSPFVLMVQRAGLSSGLADLITIVIILALLGVANTRLYVSVLSHTSFFSKIPSCLRRCNLTSRAEPCVLSPMRARLSKYLQGRERGMSLYMLLHSLLSLPSLPSLQYQQTQTWYSPPISTNGNILT